MIRSPMQDDAFRAAPRLGPAQTAAAKRQRDMNEFPRRFGPYVLLKPLARGGMGALYLALSGPEDSAKLCVIKTVLPHLADKEYLQRFRDEAKVVVRLSHGNLVPVFDSGQVAGEIYLAMDYVEGKDLRATWNRCAKKGIAFPVDVAAHIVKELARGLDYAHGFGDIKLVHRDVSPPNVLLSYSGEVRLTDFGLASSTLKLEKTAPGIIYGKVSYMSPEQARGEMLDGRTDLYASGIILWELLTGRQLFPSNKPPGAPKDGHTSEEILRRVRNPELVPPSQRASRVPPELDRIALKALAPDLKERYASCEELRHDLAKFLAQTSPTTDTARLASFLRELYDDDIAAERTEREMLTVKARESYATKRRRTPPWRPPRTDRKPRGARASAGPPPLPSQKPPTPDPAAVEAEGRATIRRGREAHRARAQPGLPRSQQGEPRGDPVAERVERVAERIAEQRRLDGRAGDGRGRPLLRAQAARRGRDGPRVRGGAHRHRPALRAEDSAPGLQPDSRPRRTAAARGARGVEDLAPERRRRHRLGDDARRRVLLRHGVPRGSSWASYREVLHDEEERAVGRGSPSG